MNKINRLIYNYNNLYKKNNIGINGSIKESDFIKIKENNNYLWDYCNDDEYEYNENLIKKNNIYNIWNNYKNSMDRKREGSSLNLCSFYNYIMNDTHIFNYKNSYIIGTYTNGFYKPSHFSPSTIREGMEMIEELCKYNNIIFIVTSDLTKMLKKMGAYTDSNFNFPMIFRNEITIKNIVTTSKKVLEVIIRKMKNNEIDELYNLNFNDFEDNNKEDKYDKYMKNYDKYASIYESIIIEEYNNIKENTKPTSPIKRDFRIPKINTDIISNPSTEDNKPKYTSYYSDLSPEEKEQYDKDFHNRYSKLDKNEIYQLNDYLDRVKSGEINDTITKFKYNPNSGRKFKEIK
jgi:hypothetical protein